MNASRSTLLILLALGVSACNSASDRAMTGARVRAQDGASGYLRIGDAAYLPAILREPVPVDAATQDRIMDEAARAAWRFIDSLYEPKTGLVHAQPDWAFPTLWDIGGSIGAHFAARELGYITPEIFEQRTRQTLETLKKARLYHGIAYGRNYDARTGDLVDESGKPSQHGAGYSALDLGRLLVWLRIVANSTPSLATEAEAVARRIDTRRIIQRGYMQGEQIMEPGKPASRYQEGRLGYEQYAAEGFALWGKPPAQALRLDLHRKPAQVMGIPISADVRGLDRLTSEPFILHGMELGLDTAEQELAVQTLAAQAQRYARTGIMTIASEDAIKLPPHYFYYYCVLCSGKAFVINVHSPGVDLDEPRWVSTKAAFAWFALAPNRYTWLAVEHVRPALDRQHGWATGVFEKDRRSTETYTLNTAAVVLEAAAYRKRGRPFILP